QAAVDRKVAAPIIGIALKRDALAWVDFADDIGAGPERRLERSLLERLGLDGVLRKHRHQSQDERKLAVVAAGQIEAHRLLADRLGLGDLGVIGAMIWPAFIAQKLPGEDDVLGGDGFAVGELRGGVEVESDVAALGVGLDRTRDQPIKRKWLVIAPSHQALDHVTADRRRRDALYDEGIEAVEGAEHALYQATALGCGGGGVGEGGENPAGRPRAPPREVVARAGGA